MANDGNLIARFAVMGTARPSEPDLRVGKSFRRLQRARARARWQVVVAAVCEICGKHPGFGMNVSHSHRRTKRRWDPNIQRVRAIVDGSPKRLNACTSCIRSGKVVKRPIRNIPA